METPITRSDIGDYINLHRRFFDKILHIFGIAIHGYSEYQYFEMFDEYSYLYYTDSDGDTIEYRFPTKWFLMSDEEIKRDCEKRKPLNDTSAK